MKQTKQNKTSWIPWCVAGSVALVFLAWSASRQPSSQIVSEVIPAGRNALAEPDLPLTSATPH